MLLVLLLLPLLARFCNSIKCAECVDSSMVPDAQIGCNATCSGTYCYRVEHTMQYMAVSSGEVAAVMGCMEYTVDNRLELGCRRNAEGLVLCVCQSDGCNREPIAAAAAPVVDLPIVADCRSQDYVDDSEPDSGETCRSNYCTSRRGAMTPTALSATVTSSFSCQEGPLLSRFDIFVQSTYTILPGQCVKYQFNELGIEEMCACPYRDNCTTSSMYPGDSGLPLDTRTTGLINCAMTSSMGFARKCKGHACFVIKRINFNERYGCIIYDERHMDRKLPVGAHEFPSENQYICETDMCNADVDSERVFYGKKSLVPKPPANESCNCFEPPTTTLPVVVADALNLALVLGIAIPSGVIVFCLAAIVAYRLLTGRWPAPLFFLGAKSTRGGGRIRSTSTVITVVSKAKTK